MDQRPKPRQGKVGGPRHREEGGGRQGPVAPGNVGQYFTGILGLGDRCTPRSGRHATALDMYESLPARETQPPAAAASTHESSQQDSEAADENRRPDPAAAVSDSVPETFGRYRLIKLLGEGAMGSVDLAEDTQLRRQVALKVPKFSAGASPSLLERFDREAQAATADGRAESTCSELRNTSSELKSPVVCSSTLPMHLLPGQ